MPEEYVHIGEIHDLPFSESSNYLSVVSCNAQRLNALPYRVIREKGRKDFHILYAESGYCRVYFDGQYYKLAPDQFILYYPGQKQEYSFCSEDPSVNSYVHFQGIHAIDILADCGMQSGIHTACNPADAKRYFRKLAQSLHPTSGASETKKNQLLLAVLCALSDKNNRADFPDAVHKAVQYLHANYMKQIEITTLADASNVSPSRFQHIFKTHMGTSPHQYLLSLRIEHAKELLTTDTLSVSAVSAMVGFEDPFYFSRIFKNKTGETPNQFRKKRILQ